MSKNILKEIIIDEISAVDQPAQRSAKAIIIKKDKEISEETIVPVANEPVNKTNKTLVRKEIYKSLTGERFYDDEDPRLVNFAKKADASEQGMAKLKTDLYNADLKKRSEELGQLPGKVEAHIALLKAVDSIESDDLRDQAMAILKSHNNTFTKGLVTKGSSAEGGEVSIEAILEKEAADIHKRDGCSRSSAYQKATELHPQAYTRARGANA